MWAQQQARKAPSRSGATCTIVPGAELVELAPGSTLSHALKGRVAGLTISTSNGMAGTGSSFNARGSSSFLGPTEPIIFVDAARITPMSHTGSGDHPATQLLDLIDPADVARVEVLRGPAATALYGTNGSGGVIHVFTKLGDHKAAPVTDPKSSCP
jgi:TonB-dependent SusC/RagA subfamily outer membrane receptor